MSVRFLHTADWQLGAAMKNAGERARDARELRFAAVERIVGVAMDEGVDFVLLAGDTFEDHDVEDRVVRRTVRLLDRLAPTPVYVLPGNHDPATAGGVWSRSAWAPGGHVRLLDTCDPVVVPGVEPETVLLPCPLTQKRSHRDPTDVLPPREAGDERVRIGVAHGALDVLPGEGTNFPIAPDRAERCGLDYLALGDWHGRLAHGERTLYPGTPEATSFGEKEPGHVLLVEIEERGATPRVEKRRVGRLTWHEERDVRLEDATDVDALDRTLRALGEPADVCLRVSVTLAFAPDDAERERLDALRERWSDAAFQCEWAQEERAAAGDEVSLPPGLLAHADEVLSTLLEGQIPDGPGRAFADREPAVVAGARELLRDVVREARR